MSSVLNVIHCRLDFLRVLMFSTALWRTGFFVVVYVAIEYFYVILQCFG